MASPSPTVLFRRAISSGTPYILKDGSGAEVNSLQTARTVSFGGQDFSIEDRTAKPVAGAHPSTLPLPVLLLAWQTKDLPLVDYLKEGRVVGIQFISTTDRLPAISWIEGKGEEDSTSKAGAVSKSITSASAGGVSSSNGVKRKYEVNAEDAVTCRKIVSKEIILKNRLDSLHGSSIKDFSAIKSSIFEPKLNKLLETLNPKSSKPPAPKPNATPDAHDPMRAKKQRNQHPIIMISSSPTALISMWNVKKFLEDGVFQSTTDAKQEALSMGYAKTEDVVVVLRKVTAPGGQIVQMKYYIVEGSEALEKFGQDAWSRVTCVLTTGQAWQFANYKWKDPKQLFYHVKGIYFQWTNEATNPNIKDWPVTELKIDPRARHQDRALVATFWRVLDASRVGGPK